MEKLLYSLGALVSLIIIKGFINFNFGVYLVLFLLALGSSVYFFLKMIKQNGYEIEQKNKKDLFWQVNILLPIFIAFMLGKLTHIVEIPIFPAFSIFDLGEGYEGTSHLLNYLTTYIPILLLLFNAKRLFFKNFEINLEEEIIPDNVPKFINEKITFSKTHYGKKWKDLSLAFLSFEIDKLDGENRKKAQIMIDYLEDLKYSKK